MVLMLADRFYTCTCELRFEEKGDTFGKLYNDTQIDYTFYEVPIELSQLSLFVSLLHFVQCPGCILKHCFNTFALVRLWKVLRTKAADLICSSAPSSCTKRWALPYGSLTVNVIPGSCCAAS